MLRYSPPTLTATSGPTSPVSEPASRTKIFLNGDFSVRTFINGEGEPRWIGVDVCRALGQRGAGQALHRLDDDEKGIRSVDTPGGPQKMLVVNEAGLYSLILRSRKPEAQRFKRWITHEVLPSIRKTGRYVARPDGG